MLRALKPNVTLNLLFFLYQQGPQFQRNHRTVKNISMLILPSLKNSVPDFDFCCLVAKSFPTPLRPSGP